MIKILLIDYEENIYKSVKLYLEKKTDVDPFAFLDEVSEDTGNQEKILECEVYWANSGHRGLELLQENHSFDLALIDMNMPPGWNGLQTIEEIRKTDSSLPIALVTANISTNEDIHNVLKQHQVRLFHKPYGRDALVNLIEEMVAE